MAFVFCLSAGCKWLVNFRLFTKLINYLNLFRRQLLVAAIKQSAVIASISTYSHQPCLFLVTVIFLPENWYQKYTISRFEIFLRQAK